MKGGVRTPGNMFESKETNPCRRQTSMFYPLLEDITSRKWIWNCITTATCSVNSFAGTYVCDREGKSCRLFRLSSSAICGKHCTSVRYSV